MKETIAAEMLLPGAGGFITNFDTLSQAGKKLGHKIGIGKERKVKKPLWLRAFEKLTAWKGGGERRKAFRKKKLEKKSFEKQQKLQKRWSRKDTKRTARRDKWTTYVLPKMKAEIAKKQELLVKMQAKGRTKKVEKLKLNIGRLQDVMAETIRRKQQRDASLSGFGEEKTTSMLPLAIGAAIILYLISRKK